MADDELTGPAIPPRGAYRPGVVNVRLVCPPDVMDAALSLLGDLLGDA
jgi:hypothetical protein